MSMVAKVVSTMEKVLGREVEVLAKKHAVIKRERKFCGQSLLRMIVLTLLKKPDAKFEDMALTAAQLGVHVSTTAVEKRFTQPLVDFLKDALCVALQQVIAAEPIAVELLERFTAVLVGDSSSISLPDELQHEFPGCGGTQGSGLAALKIQVRWNLQTGELPQVLLEVGKASDAKSPIAQQAALAGSLEIFDLGYFSLERFRRLDEEKAFFISRLQHGTTVLNEQGEVLNLREFLPAHEVQGVVDVSVRLGLKERLPSRLIAVRVPEEVANRRRQKAREKASKHGREPSAEYLELLGWSLFVTNLAPDQLTWKEAIVLYRARWQIELLFKLWKSHNQLARRRPGAKPLEVMAVLWAKLMGVLLQHWLLLTAAWPDDRRSLLKAARALRHWIAALIGVLDDHNQLLNTVTKLQTHLTCVARIQSRRKQPSHFQLLRNPELLNWAA
jgi:DDE family transposase